MHTTAQGTIAPQGFAVAGGNFQRSNPYLYPAELWSLVPRREAASSLAGSPCGRHEGSDVDFLESISSNEQLWWLVHSKPRQEKKLADHLHSLRIPHYLPVTICRAFTRGRPRYTYAPLFPGYLFLCATELQRRASFEAKRIVAMHLVVDQRALFDQLRTLADLIEKGVPLRVEERLASGQRVRVKAGILKDRRGTIIRRQGKTRLYVFVNELLGGVSLEIDQDLLEPYD